MEKLKPIYILNNGCATPLDYKSTTTAAKQRVNFVRMRLHDDFEDAMWEKIRCGIADYIEVGLGIEEQFQELAQIAFSEVLQPIQELEKKPDKIPVIIGLPEDRPGLNTDLEKNLSNFLTKNSQLTGVHFDYIFVKTGHTSTITAIEKARDILKENEFCVIGGVESYIDADTLKWLENDNKRLQCTSNRDGFVPGQAAGFCLLSSQKASGSANIPPIAKILGTGQGRENNDFDSGKYSTGLGITQAIDQSLAFLPEGQRVNQIYSTLNGESYNSAEYANAILNFAAQLAEGVIDSYVAPSNCWGDIGAASVPVFIALATESRRKNYSKGPFNLIFASSLGSSRASLLLELV